jgi:large repetitive protein
MATQSQAPSKAIITSVGLAQSGGTASDSKPVITGTADAGTTINIYDGARLIGTTTVAANGSWSFTPSADIKAGKHQFTVISVLGDNWGASSDQFVVTVPAGAQPPAAPVVTGVIDNVGPIQGLIKPNGTTDDPRPAITGTGTTGDTIKVFDNGTLIGSGTVGPDGKWSVQPVGPLANGPHEIYATETNATGTSGESAHTPFKVDTTTPATPVPVITNDTTGLPIIPGTPTNDATPDISGKGTPGDTITVYDNDTPIGSLVIPASGDWSFTPSPKLPDGPNAIVVIETNPAGTPSTPSTPINVVVDTSVPAKPPVPIMTDDSGHVIPSGSTTADAHPTISGESTPGHTITVFDGVTPIGSTTVKPDGTWSFTPATDMSNGAHPITVTDTNQAGTPSVHSDPDALIINSVVPAPPTIVSLVDAVGTITGPITSNMTTDDSRPTLNGTGVAGDVIKVYDGATLLGSLTVPAGGAWSFKPATALADGPHDIYATETNSKGTSGHSTDISFTVDTTTPATPAAPVVTDNGTLIPSGGSMPDGHPVISGTGKAGDTVKIYDGSAVIGSATIGGDGKWSFKPTTDLSYGGHDLSVIETNPAGTPSAPSPHTTFTVAVPAPMITNIVDAVGPVQGNVASGGVTDDARPVVQGTGHAGDVIMVYDGSTQWLWGSTTVDANGKWNLAPSSSLGGGTHKLFATASNNGSVSANSEFFTITIDTSVPAAPVISNVMDNVGTIKGAIALGGVTDDARPVINGTGKVGDLVKLYDGLTLIGSATVGTDGKWSIQPANALSNATHDLTATDTNTAGTVSPASAHFGFTVDTTTPVAPVISSVVDNVGTITGPIPAGGLTDDAQPVITGKGVAGDTVKLYDNGGTTPIGSAVVDANGNWSVKPATPLADGAHDIKATQTNPAGTTSPASTDWAFRVDTSVPPAPTIVQIWDGTGAVKGVVPNGGTTDETNPSISGTGVAGNTITVYDNGGKVLAVDVVDANGRWLVYPTAALSNGAHDITVKQTSPAGVVSPASSDWKFTVDTSVPSAPAIVTVVDNVGTIKGVIAPGGVTDDARPVVNGTGKVGDIVKLYDGSTLIGSATVGTDGKWSIQPANALSNATHDLSATDTNLAGTVSPASAHFGFKVDTTTPATPAAPTVTDNGSLIPSGGTMPDGHPVISGSGTSGDTIKVYDNGNVIGSTTIGGDGKWSYTPATDLSGGGHAITVIETNPAGTPSSQSAATNVTVSTIPMETVTITQLIDDSSGSQVVIQQNGSTSDTTPIVKGNVSPGLAAGETVAVYRDGAKVGTATLNGTSWSFNDSGVAMGKHTYTAQVENSSGHGPVSNSYTFTESSATFGMIKSVPSEYSVYIDVGTFDGWLYIDESVVQPRTSLYNVSTGQNVSYGYGNFQITQVSPGILKVVLATATRLPDFLYTKNKIQVLYFPNSTESTLVPLTNNDIKSLDALNGAWSPFNQGTLPGVYKSVLHSVAAPDDVGSVAATDQLHAQDTVAQPDHHTVVGEHDAFKGTAGGHETVDLNADPASYFKEATAHIEGAKGGAVDTLHLTGDHQILDLTSLTGKTAAAKISGIEVIDLGGQHNTLKLSLVDVLNLGETDLFQQDGKQQLMVNGKEGDVVDLSNSHIAGLAEGEWQQHGTTQVGGVTYNVYEHSGAHTELLVQQGVQIAVH